MRLSAMTIRILVGIMLIPFVEQHAVDSVVLPGQRDHYMMFHMEGLPKSDPARWIR